MFEKAFFVLLVSVSASFALTCWSTGGAIRNKQDVTAIITEEVCKDTDKSCLNKAYNVRGMWFYRLGCSETETEECSGLKKGMGEDYTCYCKADYCNSAYLLTPPTNLAFLLIIVFSSFFL